MWYQKYEQMFHFTRLQRYNLYRINRLTSEDFSKFFLRLGILLLTYSPERAHLEVQKTAEIISNILEYSWFFQLFRGFSYKTFKPNETQTRVIYQKNRHKIPHRTVHMWSLSYVEQKWFLYQKPPENGIIRGLKLRRFTQNQIKLHQKVSQNHRRVINSN